MAAGTEHVSIIFFILFIDADDTDFENFRLGMWKQSKEEVLDWQFNRGRTQTADTGPIKDHTSGKGA